MSKGLPAQHREGSQIGHWGSKTERRADICFLHSPASHLSASQTILKAHAWNYLPVGDNRWGPWGPGSLACVTAAGTRPEAENREPVSWPHAQGQKPADQLEAPSAHLPWEPGMQPWEDSFPAECLLDSGPQLFTSTHSRPEGPREKRALSGSVAPAHMGARAPSRRSPAVLQVPCLCLSGLCALRDPVSSASFRLTGVRSREERNCQLVRQDFGLGKARRAEGSNFFSISCIFCTTFNVLIHDFIHAHFPGQIGLYTEAITWACSILVSRAGRSLFGATQDYII